MAIGSMTTNSTVDMIDKTLSIENAPADAKATGDALAGKLGLHDMADNAAKWGGLSLRKEHNISDTWIPVFSDDNVDYVLKSEIANLNGVAASGSNYTRFTDGTQICWVDYGRLGDYSGETTWTFPLAFSGTPAVVFQAFGGNNFLFDIVGGAKTTTTQAVFYPWRNSANEFAPYGVSAIAIGRWK